MGMVIRGLQSVQQGLYAIELKLIATKTKVLDRFAQKVRDVAKENCAVDTGALQESIYNNLLKTSITEVVKEVIAGSETVIRGEGRFTTSRKTGSSVSKRPTVEYAEAHEAERKFMETAYQWANKNIEREIRRAINYVTREF